MVPGAVFPDYELSDHAARSPSCKGRIRWFSYSGAEVSVPRTAGRLRGLFSSIVSPRFPIAGLCAGLNDAAALEELEAKRSRELELAPPARHDAAVPFASRNITSL
jgi:hypothetical protein